MWRTAVAGLDGALAAGR